MRRVNFCVHYYLVEKIITIAFEFTEACLPSSSSILIRNNKKKKKKEENPREERYTLVIRLN